MTDSEIREYIKSVKWQFAKSMPKIPHEYTVIDWNPDKIESFYGFVKYIRKNGEEEAFYGKKYRYFEIDDYKYWTMGAPIEETTVINRKSTE